MLQIEQNKQLAAFFPGLKYCGESHNYMTPSAAKNYFIFQLRELTDMVNNPLNITTFQTGTNSKENFMV